MTTSPAVRVFDADGALAPRRQGAWIVEEAQEIRFEIEGGPWRLDLEGRELAWRDDLPGASLSLPFAAGRMTLTVRRERVIHPVPLLVEPAGSKLGPGLWDALLADLEAWLPGVTAGVEGPLEGGLSLHGVDLPSAVEALLPLVPAFERAVQQVLEKPRTRTVTRDGERPLHRARQATGETLAWISRHPREAAWLRPESVPELAGPPPMLPLPIAHETLDHPANRHLVWLLRRVAARLTEAARQLRAAKCSKLNDTWSWRDGRCRALDRAAHRLRRLDRTGPLRRVAAAPATEAALMVLLDAPTYARAHRLGRRILRSGLEAANPPEVATRPSFHLYELWCFLALCRSAEADLGPEWSWTWKRTGRLLNLAGDGGGAEFTGKGPNGEVTRLLFNPTFHGLLGKKDPRAPKGRHSLTRQRRPDVVWTWSDAGGSHWLALDAKYRTGRTALADAFSSAHIYRDALRWPKYGGPPRAALLLAPKKDADTRVWFEEWFRDEHAVGAVVMRPGVAPGLLPFAEGE